MQRDERLGFHPRPSTVQARPAIPFIDLWQNRYALAFEASLKLVQVQRGHPIIKLCTNLIIQKIILKLIVKNI